MNLTAIADPRAWLDKGFEAVGALAPVHSIHPILLTRATRQIPIPSCA